MNNFFLKRSIIKSLIIYPKCFEKEMMFLKKKNWIYGLFFRKVQLFMISRPLLQD